MGYAGNVYGALGKDVDLASTFVGPGEDEPHNVPVVSWVLRGDKDEALVAADEARLDLLGGLGRRQDDDVHVLRPSDGSMIQIPKGDEART